MFEPTDECRLSTPSHLCTPTEEATSMTDTIDLTPAADQVRGLTDAVTDDQLDLPTPCADWTVRDLLGHLVGLTRAFTDAAHKNPDTAPPAGEPRDLIDGQGRWNRQLDVQLDELVLHGWDLAAALMAEEEAQLYGRKTFESMRGFWPNQADDTTEITDHLNTVPKYVISSTMTDPAWQHSTVLTGDLLDETRALRDRPGGTLGVTGSISVCHELMAHDLVDEFRLFTYPTVIGQGRRLFDGHAARQQDLELVDTQQFRSGIVLLTYRPAIGH